MTKKLKVLELFAGVGGFRVGLENADSNVFETKWANQWEPSRKTQDAFEVYDYHFPNSININENIEEIKDDMFIGFNEKGEKTTFYKLLEFDSTETGKHYLAYTDNSVDEKGNVRAYGSIVTQEGDLMKLEPITTEKEWKVIEMALNVIQEQSKNEEDK